MKIFEFYLNPKSQKHADYKTFCYEPEDKTERHLGNLCLTGELTNILPPNQKLLQNLAGIIKDSYYQSGHENSEIALQHAMQAVNKFLESLSKNGNVSWMGNLHFAAAAIAGSITCFSKAGGTKIILIRNGELSDIGADLENQSLAPYPLRIFSHLIMGKVEVRDRILMLTPDVFHLLETLHLTQKLTQLIPDKEEKQLKALLRPHEKTLKEYAGIMLFIHVDKIYSASPQTKFKSGISFDAINPLHAIPKWLPKPKLNTQIFLIPLKRFRLPTVAKPSEENNETYDSVEFDEEEKTTNISKTPFKNPIFGLSRRFNKNARHASMQATGHLAFKKLIPLVLAFFCVLIIGFVLAQLKQKQTTDVAEAKILEIQQKVWQAESALVSGNEKDANNLFQEALLEIADIEDMPAKERVQKLQDEINKQLVKINKIGEPQNAQTIFSLADPEFTPEKLVRVGDTLYIASNRQPIIYFYNLTTGESARINLEKPLPLFTQVNDQLVFYDADKKQLIIPDSPAIDLFPLYADFKPNGLTAFQSSIYFLEASKGQIVKYRFLQNQPQLIPEAWLKQLLDSRVSQTIALTIDGSVWLLTKNGQIHRYWGGNWQETIEPYLWPKIITQSNKNILTHQGLPYLYILDPSEDRLIILDKQGKIIKQYISEIFNDLKDFAISQNGREVFLLNGQKIYKLPITD